MRHTNLIQVWLLICCAATPGCLAQLIRYEHLAPLVPYIDIRGMWRSMQLPAMPPTFCHVGRLGWHCHDSSKHPWDPTSLIPKDQIPAMPADASCVICPPGWTGPRKNAVKVVMGLPTVRNSGQLPPGFYDMAALKRAEQGPRKDVSTASEQQQQPPVGSG